VVIIKCDFNECENGNWFQTDFVGVDENKLPDV
jgi:hypothetical protein